MKARDAKLFFMDRRIISLLVFVALLIGLNFLFKEMNWGMHISIVGSVVITLVIWVLMGARSKSKGT